MGNFHLFLIFAHLLEKYKGVSSRYNCPGCGGKREFTRYIDNKTGAHLGDHVGMCNRINSCGYHYKPKEFLQSQNDKFQIPKPKNQDPNIRKFKKRVVSYTIPTIDTRIFEQSFEPKFYLQNKFVLFLRTLFDDDTVRKLIMRYFIGNSSHWPGATVFWQVDAAHNIRAGKVMLYDATSGKRVKEPYNHVTWVHTILKLPDYELKQCLFGGHLLKESNKPVAIVESEKTAIIASIYLPQYIWLACGGAHGINGEKFGVLKGRDVILYPDLSFYSEWQNRAALLRHICRIRVSDFTEIRQAGDEHGADIADLLIKTNIKNLGVNDTLLLLATDFYNDMNKTTNYTELLKNTLTKQYKLKAANLSLEDFVAITKVM